MVAGLIEDVDADRALVIEWDETLPPLPPEPEPIDVRRLYEALYRAWPRTYGNRLSWSQPSIEMASAVAREYEFLRAAASRIEEAMG
jgi:hypothetical protein